MGRGDGMLRVLGGGVLWALSRRGLVGVVAGGALWVFVTAGAAALRAGAGAGVDRLKA